MKKQLFCKCICDVITYATEGILMRVGENHLPFSVVEEARILRPKKELHEVTSDLPMANAKPKTTCNLS